MNRKPDDSDRRKFARLDLALTVSYKVAGQAAGKPIDPREAISSDISLGGLRLMAPTRLENGTLLDIEIILGENEDNPIKASAEVVWQNKISETSYETGVMIKDMPSADKSEFMKFVFDQMAKVIS
jgi:c-di-GMP-binding flagellar brake protein YcgR